jgi:NAD(P)H-dependent FMN reductase
MRILAISGSLRAGSSNTALVDACVALAPEGVEVSVYEGMGDLPHFNPDLDVEPATPAVADFRRRLKAADAVLISSPEYAHGVPGTLKNALDWVVGSAELVWKPVALVNVSPASAYAHAQLLETLTVMTASVVPQASVVVPLAGRRLDAAGIVADPELSAMVRSILAALARAAEASRAAGDPMAG